MLTKVCATLFLATLFSIFQGPIPSDYKSLVEMSREELELKMEAHRGWGMDKMERWDLAQDAGELIFTLPGGLKASAPAQIIGTYFKGDNTWMWAWANNSIDDKLKVDSLKVKKYGEEHKIERLTNRKWVATEKDAWDMVAVAVKLCGSQGGYRGPSGETGVFISFGEIKCKI